MHNIKVTPHIIIIIKIKAIQTASIINLETYLIIQIENRVFIKITLLEWHKQAIRLYTIEVKI